MKGRQPVDETEKVCTACDFGIMYTCKFEDGEKLWLCDMCRKEEKVDEPDTSGDVSGESCGVGGERCGVAESSKGD